MVFQFLRATKLKEDGEIGKMPFKVHKVDGGYKVSSPKGDKSKHPVSKEKARAQQAAIYANWDGKEDTVIETDKVSQLPSMLKVPRCDFDYACPHCKKIMGEKDFSFKYVGNGNGNIWTHTCKPNSPFIMAESREAKTNKSGFSKEETDPPTYADKQKVKKIIDDKKFPETAEEGKAYIVHWADGRGIFACKTKKYLTKWLNDTGSWAEIVSIKYGEPKHGSTKLKVIKEEKESLNLRESLKIIFKNIFFEGQY